MSDEMDIVQSLEERERAALIAQRKPLHLGGDDRTVAPADCIDCDTEIPTERLRAYPDAVRCVVCETRAEDRRARMRMRGI